MNFPAPLQILWRGKRLNFFDRLRVIKSTVLEPFYQMGQVPPMSREEYLSLIIDFREGLDPTTVVPHRVVGGQARHAQCDLQNVGGAR
jgi:radical SAM superfamily enzyme